MVRKERFGRGRESEARDARRRCANICRVAERYLEQLKHAKVRGYLFEQQNYIEKS